MSLIGGTTKGDSNSFDSEETGFTGEERATALSAAYGEWLPPFSRKQKPAFWPIYAAVPPWRFKSNSWTSFLKSPRSTQPGEEK
jgi:hypothetical protein